MLTIEPAGCVEDGGGRGGGWGWGLGGCIKDENSATEELGVVTWGEKGCWGDGGYYWNENLQYVINFNKTEVTISCYIMLLQH